MCLFACNLSPGLFCICMVIILVMVEPPYLQRPSSAPVGCCCFMRAACTGACNVHSFARNVVTCLVRASESLREIYLGDNCIGDIGAEAGPCSELFCFGQIPLAAASEALAAALAKSGHGLGLSKLQLMKNSIGRLSESTPDSEKPLICHIYVYLKSISLVALSHRVRLRFAIRVRVGCQATRALRSWRRPWCRTRRSVSWTGDRRDRRDRRERMEQV